MPTNFLSYGFLKIYTGSQPANDGSVTGTLTAGTAGNTGTAGYFALVKSDNSSSAGSAV